MGGWDGRGGEIILQFDPVGEGAEVVAEMGDAGGLDSGEGARGEAAASGFGAAIAFRCRGLRCWCVGGGSVQWGGGGGMSSLLRGRDETFIPAAVTRQRP